MIAANAYVVRGLLMFCAQRVVAALLLLKMGHRDVRLSTKAAKAAMIVMHVMPAVLE